MTEKLSGPLESQKSIEFLKNEYHKRLNSILNKQLTVENIETFANDALNQTLELVSDLLKEYRNNLNFEVNLNLNIREQEDFICQSLGLPNIQEVLENIIVVQQKIDKLKRYLENTTEKSSEIITPPDHTEETIIPNSGNHTFEQKKLIPKLLTLMYILESDFKIDVQNTGQVQVVEGQIKNTMMREAPYVRVVIPSLDRVVYVCDEIENITYVFDTKKIEELGITLSELDLNSKSDKNSLIEAHSSVGVRIVQNKNWRFKLSSCLKGDIFNDTNENSLIREDNFSNEFKELPRVSSGELDLWKGYYTDPVSGKHFSTLKKICETLNEKGYDVSISFIFGQDITNLESKNIIYFDGHTRIMYAWEDIVTSELISKLSQPRLVDKDEWAYFWQDPESGNHFATISQLAKKILIDERILKRIISELESTDAIQKRVARSTKFDLVTYPYEVLINNPKIINLLNRFSTESDGEWKNFYIDAEGKHWGTVGAIRKKTLVHPKTLKLIIAEYGLSSKYTDQGESFCLETIMASSLLKERSEAKATLNDGEWKGFYFDESSGKHIGTLKAISKKAFRSYSLIKRLVELYKIKPIKILVNHQTSDGYCYEDILVNFSQTNNHKE